MKVLVITSLFPNNVYPDFGNFIFQRMAAFSKIEGNSINVISPVPYCPTWIKNERWSHHRWVKKEEKRSGIQIYHPRYPFLPKIAMPFHGVLMAFGIIGLATRLHRLHSFDLIDGHFIFPDGLAAVLTSAALKIPVVLSARGTDIHQFPSFRTIRPQIVQTLNHADRIVSVCKALKDAMCTLGIHPSKIDIIPNGIDAKRFDLLDREEARGRIGIPLGSRVVLSVGSLVPVKAHHRIIRAMPMVLGRHSGTKLFIVGRGPEQRSLQALIDSLNLSHSVTLAGPRPNEELGLWYNAADVFCLASSREGWANVIMESMACGTPVVATNVFGAPEIITKPDVGSLVEQDPESIANAIKAALDRSWNRQIIRDHVASRSWEVVAREVSAVFEKALIAGGRK